MCAYHRISRHVEPKRQALKEATLVLQNAERVLAAKREQLQALLAAIAAMMADLDRVNRIKGDLEAQAADCVKRIDRAARLIQGLGGEKERCVEHVLQRCHSW